MTAGHHMAMREIDSRGQDMGRCVSNLVFLSRYMRPEEHGSGGAAAEAVGSSCFTYNLFHGTRPSLPVIVGPPTDMGRYGGKSVKKTSCRHDPVESTRGRINKRLLCRLPPHNMKLYKLPPHKMTAPNPLRCVDEYNQMHSDPVSYKMSGVEALCQEYPVALLVLQASSEGS